MEIVTEDIKIEKYGDYKDSGVEWLGTIPVHWQIEKGKWLFEKQNRPVRKDDKIVTCYRDGEVTLRENRRADGYTTALKEHGYQGIRKGDLVIHNMDAFAGSIGVSDSDGKSTPVYSACTPRFENKSDSYFYSYFLRHLALTGFIESLAKGIRERSTDFRFNDFGVLLLSVPPLKEQTQISQFLDQKTALIDQAIAQKEQLIQLLQERRQILIHQAVTRGLDKKVEMKDSGVEWIGEIPKHWEVKRLKYVAEIEYGISPHERTYNTDGEGTVLVNGPAEYSKTEFGYTRSIKWTTAPVKFAKKTSLLFCLRGSTTGRLNICHQELAIGRGCAALNARINHDFFIKAIISLKAQILETFKGSTFPSVTKSDLDNYSIAIPPTEEQNKISNFIDDKFDKLKMSISLKQQEIQKLKEYKTTLINAAVTGKIKVAQ